MTIKNIFIRYYSRYVKIKIIAKNQLNLLSLIIIIAVVNKRKMTIFMTQQTEIT